MDLKFADPNKSKWSRGFLNLQNETVLRSSGAARKVIEAATSALSNFDFRISRFGVSHGSVAKTGANAQTANVSNPIS